MHHCPLVGMTSSALSALDSRNSSAILLSQDICHNSSVTRHLSQQICHKTSFTRHLSQDICHKISVTILLQTIQGRSLRVRTKSVGVFSFSYALYQRAEPTKYLAWMKQRVQSLGGEISHRKINGMQEASEIAVASK